MYSPRQNGITPSVSNSVVYAEALPPDDSAELAYCFWELRTLRPLPQDFFYLVVPDACVDIVFDLKRPEVFIMTPHTASEQINLGTDFHYLGIRLQPGAYRGDLSQIVGGALGVTELAGEPAADIVQRLADKSFPEQQEALGTLVRTMADAGTLAENLLVQEVIDRIGRQSFGDVAVRLGYSERQVRRIVRASTGFSPRELQKIITFQRAFSTDWRDLYVDQSHYIHSFRRIARQTPGQFERAYVRNVQYGSSLSD